MVSGEFVFHPVGQGLFYSGHILSESGRFTFVFDCGGEPTECVSIAVREYALKNDCLDLLFVSHFHEDHVNGLMDLTNATPPKMVVMPYVDAITRFVIAMGAKSTDSRYYEFLSDPIGFFQTIQNCTVYVLGSRGPSESREPDQSNEPLNETALLADPELADKVESEEGRKYESNVRYVKGEGRISQLGWEFGVFNRPVDRSRLTAFREKLSRQGLVDRPTIKEAIRDKGRREQIRSCYGELYADLNAGSLVVCHGPHTCRPSESELLIFIKYYVAMGVRGLHAPDITPPFTLLTGDLGLRDTLTDMTSTFFRYLDKIGLVLLPHHGAARSWDARAISVFRRTRLWVASYGCHNRYRHPGERVLWEISREAPESLFLGCNERCAVSYRVT